MNIPITPLTIIVACVAIVITHFAGHCAGRESVTRKEWSFLSGLPIAVGVFGIAGTVLYAVVSICII